MPQAQIFSHREHGLECPGSKVMICGTMIFRDKLKILMDLQHVETGDVAKHLSISYSNVYRWLSEKPEDANRYPTASQMLGLSRLFSVTMESLADDSMEITPAKLRHDEQEVVEAYRRLKVRRGLDYLDAILNMGDPRFAGKPAIAPEDQDDGKGAYSSN